MKTHAYLRIKTSSDTEALEFRREKGHEIELKIEEEEMKLQEIHERIEVLKAKEKEPA